MPRKSEMQLSPVGVKIHAVRVRKDIMLTQIARKADLQYTQVYRIMHGLSNPSYSSLLRICKALQCTPHETSEIFSATPFRAPTQDELECDPVIAA